ncbi:MAG: A1 family peptidase [Kangiellaceae bacterium]|nr:A1 family peptidase [Kangiellaceae bacterium]
MPRKTMKLPISIVAAKGGYCVQMELGSKQTKVNLLLDTGSSTLAVDTNKYKPDQDFYLQATPYAQTITYGSGGWAGPLINTHLQLETDERKMTLKEGHLAIIESEQQNNFYGADGILGLAYRQLNRAYNLTEYFQERNYSPEQTYPWPFSVEDNKKAVRTFKQFLKTYPYKKPKAFFTELEEHKISKNKFSLYCKRAVVHVEDNNLTTQQLEADPLNQGWMILGAGEEHKELYDGYLQIIDVVHDAYYNTKLLAMQVGEGDIINVPPPTREERKPRYSNSIIDCGSSFMVLQQELYQELLDQLLELNIDFIRHIDLHNSAGSEGYFPQDLDLNQWPDVHFYFKGEQEDDITKVSCTPDNYWQINAMQAGRAWFMFMNELPNIPNMSIMGLPLISDYFVIFDREYDANGVIKVGKIEL